MNVLTVAAPTLSLQTWLAQLDQMDNVLPTDTTIYIGHGPSGPATPLIDDQRKYLLLLERLVEEASADADGVSADETADGVLQMRLAYPHHRGAAFMPPEKLIEASVGWVAEQLAEKAGI